jgi:hypothetical protein
MLVAIVTGQVETTGVEYQWSLGSGFECPEDFLPLVQGGPWEQVAGSQRVVAEIDTGMTGSLTGAAHLRCKVQATKLGMTEAKGWIAGDEVGETAIEGTGVSGFDPGDGRWWLHEEESA